MKPWLAHYDPGVPASLAPYPPLTLLDYVADHARHRPDQPAALFQGASLTYRRLEELTDSLAASLAHLGVRRGDRVALLLPNCPQFLVAEIGAWKAGAIVAPLNPLYTDRELEEPLRDHEVETIVTLSRFYERVKRLQPKTPVRRVIATGIKEFLPPVLRVLYTLARERREGERIRLQQGDRWLTDLLRPSGNGAPRSGATGTAARPSDPAVLLLSGGTTGTPKGVVGLHSAYTISGLQIQAWMSPALGAPGADAILLPLPLFHVYANVGVQSFAFITANPIALVPNPRDLDDVVKTVVRTRPAFFNGVPTLYQALLNHPSVRGGKADFKSIKICFSGAAALLAETKQRFESLTGGRIVEGYSLTEAMMALCVNPARGTGKIGSVGMPLPDVDVRIVDADTGERTLAAGEVGEIWLTGAQLMPGYWNRPLETADVVTEDAGHTRWLRTGDLGFLDDDGYLFIVDRKKDLIKTSGYQVWPREVEEAIAKHPAVAEVGVAGVFDALKGEAVKAWVVLRPNASASDADLRAHCRRELAPYKVPSHIEFRTELPKTMVGKVLRRKLRDL